MPNYRRPNLAGGTYFITQVTYHREPWLCSEVGRKALREAMEKVGEKYPFSRDFAQHCDYIHYNPVKHGLCKNPQDWQFSSIHRFIAQGIYPPNWGVNKVPEIAKEIGKE